MEILQGNINREDFYSVRECAEVLGVNPKTIRNRIESKKIPAIWYEQGKGLSCWLIPKEDIDSSIESSEVVSTVPLPINIMEEIKAIVKAENQELRAELQSVNEKLDKQEEMLNNHFRLVDERLRTLSEVKEQPKPLSWWSRLFD